MSEQTDTPLAEALDNLHNAIENVIFLGDPNGVLTQEIRDRMTESLTDNTWGKIDKFIKGQTEHGGDIRDRDLDAELSKELDDAFWYNAAKKWKHPKH